MLRILDMQDGLRQYARPNHWNAPDMMEVGNGKLTPGEDHAHFAMWYRLAVPLIASHDLRQMDPQITSLLTMNESSPSTKTHLGCGVSGLPINTA